MEFYLEKLDEYFHRKKRTNANYSLRAYARDLGVHPSTLSKILKKTRSLPLDSVERVSHVLNLNQSEKNLFVESLFQQKGLAGIRSYDWIESSGFELKNEAHFNIISQWEYYALLNLIKLKSFRSDHVWIAQKLNISTFKVQKVIQDLLKVGLLSLSAEGNLVREYKKIKTTDEFNSLALRISHQNDLRLAAKKIWEIPVEKRDFTTMIVPGSPEKLKKAKKLVRDFLQKMEDLLEGESSTEVYQVAVQVFPLTQSKGTKIWKKK